jgi:hypothetical protein
MSKTFTLEVPATNADVGKLMLRVLAETSNLDERVVLKYGTCRLVASDERDREAHPGTVSVKEALETLAKSSV